MKKPIYANLSKTCGLSRMSVVLNFPQSVDPQVSVRKWPSGKFVLKVVKDGEATALVLETSGKSESLATFRSEEEARAALNQVYDKLLNRKVRAVLRWAGYVLAGLAAWTTVLFAYGIFVTFGPSAAHSARLSNNATQSQAASTESAANNPVVLPQIQGTNGDQPSQSGNNVMGNLADQALADVQRQAAIEQEKIAEQMRAQQGQPGENRAVTSGGGDINDAFAAAKK